MDISPEDKDVIATTLCHTLPQALNHFLHKEQLYLFNEHYVVKPPNSDITFRWHRDADEQLQFCHDQNLEYHSLWCPLDSVNAANGTLQVPSGTNIYTVDLQDLRGNMNSSELTADLISSHCTSDTSRKEEKEEKKEGKEDGGCDQEVNSPPDSCLSPVNIAISPGSGVVFSSLLWHCSGSNTSTLSRRVLYAQYSDTIITSRPAAGNRSGSSAVTDAGFSHSPETETETATNAGRAVAGAAAGKRKRGKAEEEEEEEGTPSVSVAREPLCFAVPCDIAPSAQLITSSFHQR